MFYENKKQLQKLLPELMLYVFKMFTALWTWKKLKDLGRKVS